MRHPPELWQGWHPPTAPACKGLWQGRPQSHSSRCPGPPQGEGGDYLARRPASGSLPPPRGQCSRWSQRPGNSHHHPTDRPRPSPGGPRSQVGLHLSGEGLWPPHPGSEVPCLCCHRPCLSCPLPLPHCWPCPGPGSPGAPLQLHRLSPPLGTPPAGAPISRHHPLGAAASAETRSVPLGLRRWPLWRRGRQRPLAPRRERARGGRQPGLATAAGHGRALALG